MDFTSIFGNNCDLVLTIGNSEVQVHSNILASRVPSLHNQIREAITQKKSVLSTFAKSSIPKEDLESALKLIYCGKYIRKVIFIVSHRSLLSLSF